jgi:hypothetical protein
MNNLTNLSNDELLQQYQNAAATDCGSIGHTKGKMNEIAAKQYAAELINRKTSVPNYYAAAEKGKFNGIGSF